MVPRYLLLTILLWLMTGCVSLSEKRQSDLLVETLNQYEAAIRWGAMRQAENFATEEVVGFNPVAAKGLRIIHYEVVQGPTLVSENKALQTVLIQYVWESSQTVRELLDQQVWVYDVDVERWNRESPLPAFE